jgi:hypothetical protein
MSAALRSYDECARAGLVVPLRPPVLPRSAEADPTLLAPGKSLVTKLSTKSPSRNKSLLASLTVLPAAVSHLLPLNLHDPRSDAPQLTTAAPLLQLHHLPISEFPVLLSPALLLTTDHMDDTTMYSLTMFQQAEAVALTGNTALQAPQLAMEV